MKIWILDNTIEKYDCIEVPDFSYATKKYFQTGFRGNSMIEKWEEVYSRVVTKNTLYTDVPYASTSLAPIFTKTAIECLKPLFDNVECLPLLMNERYIDCNQLYAINVLDTCDCIDYDKSIINRLSSGMICGFEKYVFKEEAIKKHIFKIPELIFEIFYSEDFVRLVEENGLKGFKFKIAWDSEAK